MKRRRLLLVALIVMGFGIGVVMFSYLQRDNTVAPQVEGEQERIGRVPSTATETNEPHKDSEDITLVEIPEQVESEISGLVEQPQSLSAPGPVEKDEENPLTPEKPSDPVATAWARLDYISQNLQEWGELSPEATELMEQLTPTWRAKTRGETEEVIVLLDELSKLHDPRSAEIFVHYLDENGLWIRYMEATLIAIGPPSVPPLVSVLADNGGFLNSVKRKRATKLLGIIGAEYQRELGGAVKYILLPKLEELAMLDPDYYGIRAVASKAISRLSSRERDSTVASQIEGKRQRTDRVTTTVAETNEQSQIPRVPGPVEENGENLPAPEKPADPVTAAWARLDYISQNPHEWGEFSPEAAELMAQLTPTWVFDEADGEGPAEDAFKLLVKLAEFQDPRSAQVIANYINEGFGLSNEAVIPIGLPLVPPLIPLLDANTRFVGRLKSVRILGILAEKHRHELNGVVEHILLPKLKKLATSDPSPIIREIAGEAISRFSYPPQDDILETPEVTDHEISEIIEPPQVLHTPEPSEEDKGNSPAPEELPDPVTAAWTHLEYISQNPQEWGVLSPEATVLIEQLTPTWVMRSEGEGEEAIELLDQLTKLHDPRSAEIFVNYMRAGIGGRPMEAALITIGPPSVLPLISLLADNEGFLNRKRAAELLGTIGFEYQEELGGVVEYIVLPKLKELATLDPSLRVREVAGEAISRFSYPPQDNAAETPEAVDCEISESIEPPQVLHTLEPSEKNKGNSPAPEELPDPVAAAWARLSYISQNPQEWGVFSPEATVLIEQLTPTRTISAEEEMEEVIVLLEKLGKLRDPRSAEIIMNYFLGLGLWEKPMKQALIAIGPPSVPLLIPLLEADTRLLGRLIGAKLLGIIGSEHRQELGGAVEHIILPKLEKLVTSDPSPRVRWYASVAISRIRYQQQGSTVEIPEQVESEINEIIEQPQVPHALEPAAEDEEDPTENQ